MKNSIMMTVSDREPEVLLGTLRWLRACNLADTEIVIVNDCSRIDYAFVKEAYKDDPIRWIDLEPYECMKIEENYNNPAKAFNAGLAACRGENVAIMSSDVIVPPRVLEAAFKHDTEYGAWTPMVIDLGSSNEYNGPHRVFPMPWFLYCKRQHAVDCGGWDENYLLGMCWEDNDFVGRLALECKHIVCDWQQIVWHQSHDQPAYKIDNHWIKAANDRNRKYTMDKWTALPFAGPTDVAFEMIRGRNDDGDFCLTFNDIKGIKDKVRNETLSPFVSQGKSDA